MPKWRKFRERQDYNPIKTFSFLLIEKRTDQFPLRLFIFQPPKIPHIYICILSFIRISWVERIDFNFLTVHWVVSNKAMENFVCTPPQSTNTSSSIARKRESHSSLWRFNCLISWLMGKVDLLSFPFVFLNFQSNFFFACFVCSKSLHLCT